MARKFFGTDGIRGMANRHPMTADMALKVAQAAGRYFAPTTKNQRRLAVIGKDTRLSGYMLEPAITAGFISLGMDVVLLGPMPTPAVATLTRSMRAELGVMISASHNPYHDNGIKLFGPDGDKLSDEVELAIERLIDEDSHDHLAEAPALGRARRLADPHGRYIEIAKASFPKDLRLDGLKIVIDCAHGAGYRVAPTVLYELGAEVIAIGDAPNGFNINDGCGATAPSAMQQKVIAEGADLGIAIDGDADRVIMADERGHLIDGDQIMGLIAASWAEDGRLRGGGLVTTVMSNMGLERFLEGHGLSMERTAVGDRYVLARMHQAGFNLGGEQSGHVIMSDYATTGDGLIAALQVLAVAIRSAQPMSDVARVFEPLPQLLRNIRYNGGEPLAHQAVKDALAASEAQLATRGRVVLRPSGTEPVIRVMAEGEDEDEITQVVDRIAAAISASGSVA
ncbi:MAG: phosphoglucosamine mutase [Rhodospirillaceae bacterium]